MAATTKEIAQLAESFIGQNFEGREFKRAINRGASVTEALHQASGGRITGAIAEKIAMGQRPTGDENQGPVPPPGWSPGATSVQGVDQGGGSKNDHKVAAYFGQVATDSSFDPNNPIHRLIAADQDPRTADLTGLLPPVRAEDTGPNTGQAARERAQQAAGGGGQSEASLGKIVDRTTIDGQAAARQDC